MCEVESITLSTVKHGSYSEVLLGSFLNAVAEPKPNNFNEIEAIAYKEWVKISH